MVARSGAKSGMTQVSQAWPERRAFLLTSGEGLTSSDSTHTADSQEFPSTVVFVCHARIELAIFLKARYTTHGRLLVSHLEPQRGA
jgi:hypothetical protein